MSLPFIRTTYGGVKKKKQTVVPVPGTGRRSIYRMLGLLGFHSTFGQWIKNDDKGFRVNVITSKSKRIYLKVGYFNQYINSSIPITTELTNDELMYKLRNLYMRTKLYYLKPNMF